MGNPYPAAILREDGTIDREGAIDFTDPANQPGATPGGPYVPAAPGGDVVVLEDTAGDPLIQGGDDTGGVNMQSEDGTKHFTVNDAGISITGDVNVTGSGVFNGPDGENALVAQPFAGFNAMQGKYSTGGDGLLVGDDAGGVVAKSPDGAKQLSVTDSGTAVSGPFDADSLGAGPAYVTVQAMPPAGPYQTPLVYDSTAVTGGCYAWDGATYQKISNVVA